MNEIIIRRATANEADLIADISRYTFYKTYLPGNRPEDIDRFLAKQFARERLVKEVFDEENVFLLAMLNKDIAGYAKLKSNILKMKEGNFPTIEIARLYCMPQCIGKGVGHALMQACIDFALSKNNKVVWLGVWEKNPRAIAFYKKWGFEKFALHFFEMGKDLQTDWVMRKWI